MKVIRPPKFRTLKETAFMIEFLTKFYPVIKYHILSLKISKTFSSCKCDSPDAKELISMLPRRKIFVAEPHSKQTKLRCTYGSPAKDQREMVLHLYIKIHYVCILVKAVQVNA